MNSGAFFVNVGILTQFFQTLVFWPYFHVDLCITGYWQYYLNALPSSDCGLMFHAPRGHILWFFVLCRSFVSEHGRGCCRHPSWCSGSCSPGCDTSAWTSCLWWKSLTAHWGGSLFSFAFSLVFCSLHMLCVLCRINAGHGCFGNIHHLFRSSRSICLLSCFFLWRVVLACKVAFLAYVVFLMVFRFWPHVLWKLVFMGSAAFKFPFYSVCRFLTRFHGGYYSSFNFHSVSLLSSFLSVRCFQVALLASVVFKLVSLVNVTFRLFSRSVSLSR